MSACTADDHDTTDPFCGYCGERLGEPGQCDWCDRDQHTFDGFPFCACCGATNPAAEAVPHA